MSVNTEWEWEGGEPAISGVCPDCGSSDWVPIMYGLPTEEARERAVRGEFVLGGCCCDYASRLCKYCHNYWPTRPYMGGLGGPPDSRKRQVDASLREYKRLCKMADDSKLANLPEVEGAWARIDGTIHFLIAFRNCRARLTRALTAVREGGAPTYHLEHYAGADWKERAESEKMAAVAAIRFERSNEPSRKNLFNDWQIIRDDSEPLMPEDPAPFPYGDRRAQRQRTSTLIRFAKAVSLNEFPSAERVDATRFRIFSSDWGYVRVDRTSPKLDLAETFEYTCGYNRKIEQSEDPERARALACAAALLLDFPQFAKR